MDALIRLQPHSILSPQFHRDVIEEATNWADSILTKLRMSLKYTTFAPTLATLLSVELYSLSVHISQERMDFLFTFFPTVAALGYSLHKSFAETQQQFRTASKSFPAKHARLITAYGQSYPSNASATKQQLNPTTCTVTGLLNFGYSGGMAPGDRIANRTWNSASKIMAAHGCSWFLGIGARCPDNVKWHIEFPKAEYTLLGQRTTSFNGVVALIQPSLQKRVIWETAWSHSPYHVAQR